MTELLTKSGYTVSDIKEFRKMFLETPAESVRVAKLPATVEARRFSRRGQRAKRAFLAPSLMGRYKSFSSKQRPPFIRSLIPVGSLHACPHPFDMVSLRSTYRGWLHGIFYR